MCLHSAMVADDAYLLPKLSDALWPICNVANAFWPMAMHSLSMQEARLSYFRTEQVRKVERRVFLLVPIDVGIKIILSGPYIVANYPVLCAKRLG